MYLKYIDNNKYINKIEELYLNSFPEDERFPFWILEEASKESNSDLYDIYFIKQSKITIFFFDALKNPAPQNAVLTL